MNKNVKSIFNINKLHRTSLRPKDWLHEKFQSGELDKNLYDRSWEPRLAVKPSLQSPISQPCTSDQIYLPRYRQWTDEMHQPYYVHRKLWEWVFICQALENFGCFAQGMRGLGFGVGTEPISAIAVRRGATVVATDGPKTEADESGWIETNQHASDVASLNIYDVCPQDIFEQRVEFQTVDMRNIPDTLKDFDFTWSACALEHLGGLQEGFDFVWKSLDCLKPGGVAVHTTEFNVSSDTDTIDSGHTVLYRKQDLKRFAKELKSAGHHIELTFGMGTTDDDRHIDEKPYTNCHLKTRQDGFVITSFGLIIKKSK